MDQNGLFEKGRNGQPFLFLLGSAFVEQIQMIQCPCQCWVAEWLHPQGSWAGAADGILCSFHLLGPFSAIMSVAAGKLQPRHQLEHLLTMLDPCHPQFHPWNWLWRHRTWEEYPSPNLASEPNIPRLQHPYGSADSETEGVASWVDGVAGSVADINRLQSVVKGDLHFLTSQLIQTSSTIGIY